MQEALSQDSISDQLCEESVRTMHENERTERDSIIFILVLTALRAFVLRSPSIGHMPRASVLLRDGKCEKG